jgi:hypothetical protein
MLQTPELAGASETLYRVFRRYELRSNTDACSCHHSERAEQRLHSKPLNKLSCSDLQRYARDVIYTWGTGDDFKHFLPRIFELVTNLADPALDLDTAASIFGRLNYESWCSTRWRTWRKEEQSVLSDYFEVVWETVLLSDLEDLPFDAAHEWIAAIAQAEHDLSKYLDRWLQADSPNAHRSLAAMIVQQGLPNAKSPSGGYWAGHREQWNAVERLATSSGSTAQARGWLRALERFSFRRRTDGPGGIAAFLESKTGRRKALTNHPTDRPESRNHAHFRSVQSVNSVPHVSCAAELLGYNQL